ncbi:glycosyltransferase [Candidatus Woesearchaeota archaeon]|nr:glycosyltransferase [Candidatus Woesearchaeota archaeon]
MKILYLLDVFPVISETFILNEITELIDLGHNINIVSLNKPEENKLHRKVKEYDLVNKTRYLKFNPKEGREKYSREEVFEKSITELIEDNLDQKFKILESCYKKETGKEISLRKFLDVLDIIRVIKKEKIEHIHCHFAFQNVRIAYIINKIIGIPYTFTTHAYDIFVNPSKDIKKWADNAKKVITVSGYNKKYMNEKFGIDEGKIEVVHCGIELEKFRPGNKEKEGFNISSIARLTEKKGLKYLIEACSLLESDFKCNIFGEGPLKDELQGIIDKNELQGKVELKGAANQKEILDELNKSNIFVLPCVEARNNDRDGIPVSLMEAMAMEIPTISTDVTGIPELIEDGIGGVIVPQKNSKALAEAIVKVKNDKEFTEKIRKKGREKIEEEFDVKKNIKRLVGVFER